MTYLQTGERHRTGFLWALIFGSRQSSESGGDLSMTIDSAAHFSRVVSRTQRQSRPVVIAHRAVEPKQAGFDGARPA